MREAENAVYRKRMFYLSVIVNVKTVSENESKMDH